MKKNELVESRNRLEHILQAIAMIEAFTTGKSEEIFIKDALLNNAVLFQFSVIGEAINHVDREILEKYDYPWYRVRAFRNLIAHEYFHIKMLAVWNIIEKDLSGLKEVIEIMMANEYGLHE